MQLPIESLPRHGAPEQRIVRLHGGGGRSGGAALAPALHAEFRLTAVPAPGAAEACDTAAAGKAAAPARQPHLPARTCAAAPGAAAEPPQREA